VKFPYSGLRYNIFGVGFAWDEMKGHKIMILIKVFRVFLKLKIQILDGCLQSADQGDDKNTLKAIALNFGLVNLNPAGTITPDQLPDTIK
jgi:hypothetical protein